eukprot:GFKZ01011883.1.p1 GENE.GFKZ01011883.1~~GFKZ01011883.1.p1  ORF type:complete len:325 (-),score=39.13 GFKZ01011883.1:240-1214(-)
MSPPPSQAPSRSHSDATAIRLARVSGSAFAGVVELVGFHPVDTVAKRLMNHVSTIRQPGMSTTMALQGYSRVIFREAHSERSLFRKYASLFPGLHFAAGYKILQRVYKFGGQPFVREMMTRRFGERVDALTGGDKVRSKLWLHAISGAVVGIGEVALLPLDVLKIKSQTNPGALRGRGLVTILKEERLAGLYRGAGWTAARNAPGSFALFGASAFVKGRVFGLENFNDATFAQTFVASAVGGLASITVASPLDVIKTRLQTRDFGSGESGFRILRELLVKEGVGGLFKGLVPKVLVVGPKLVFSFTVAQHTIGMFEEMFTKRKA